MLFNLQGDTPAENAETAETVVVPVDDRNVVEKAKDWAIDYAPSLVGAILIFIIGRWVAKTVTGVVRRLMTARNVDPTLTGFLGNLVYFVLLTMVIIAHRLTTVRHCDQVCLIEKGRVAARGSFDELEAENPRFAEMVEAGAIGLSQEAPPEIGVAG